MEYSQKPILDHFKKGNVSNEEGAPKHIETVISNVFLFKDVVYKIYKNNNVFFNENFRNISTKEERFAFTKNDFHWNNLLSPTIYKKLVGLSVENGQVIFGDAVEEADELAFEMSRVNQKDVLFDRLVRGDISESQCYEIGKQLAQALKKVRAEKPVNYDFTVAFKKRIEDIRSWAADIPEFVSDEEQSRYCKYLESCVLKNGAWFKELNKEVANCGDVHSMNAALVGENFMLMDTYSPKDEWLVDHELDPFYRLGTDIWAITGNQKYFEAFAEGYQEGSGEEIDRKLDDVYIIYAAGIMVPYLYMLQKNNPEIETVAEKYHAFIREFYEKVA